MGQAEDPLWAWGDWALGEGAGGGAKRGGLGGALPRVSHARARLLYIYKRV